MVWPLYKQYVNTQIRLTRFPVLADFEDPSDITFWIAEQGDHTERHPSDKSTIVRILPGVDESHHLKVELGRGRWSGVSFYPPIANWEKYRLLSFSLCRHPSTIRLAIRVDDNQETLHTSDRFNRLLPEPEESAAGCQLIEIPVDDIRRGPKVRLLDVAEVKRIVIFSANQKQDPDQSNWFTVDNVLLK